MLVLGAFNSRGMNEMGRSLTALINLLSAWLRRILRSPTYLTGLIVGLISPTYDRFNLLSNKLYAKTTKKEMKPLRLPLRKGPI